MKKRHTVFTTILLVCFGLLPKGQGVVPPPDGGYPGGNTAEGQNALLSLTGGTYNTAVGWFSLASNAEGNFNTAIGAGTLLVNTADENTATGAGALLSNTTGAFNTAHGAFALVNNTEGGGNTAIGDGALGGNISGSLNTANGLTALASNTTGDGNTAAGESALFSNTTGGLNTANGFEALLSLTSGEGNTAIGALALENSTGSNNTALGVGAGVNVTTANNVIAIDNPGVNVSNSCFIGHIYNVVTHSVTSVPVIVTDEGQLGTIPSSERFKKDIATMAKASEAILSVTPVTFRYKNDAKGTPQFGLIAEEVAKVNPDLVVHDKEGKPYSVRYDQVNAMLLNEFLKAHRKMKEQEATIIQLKSTVAQQQKELEAKGARQEEKIEALAADLKEQTLQIQKVSAQLEVNKPASYMVHNDH